MTAEKNPAELDLENLWSDLALAITAVGQERETVFLAKLVMLLAREAADPDRLPGLIALARRDL